MTDKTPEALELADLLEEHAQDHLDVALSCDMRPEHTANWAHMVAANEAAALLRRQHQRIEALEKALRVAADDLETAAFHIDGTVPKHVAPNVVESTAAGKTAIIAARYARALLSTTQQEDSQS